MINCFISSTGAPFLQRRSSPTNSTRNNALSPLRTPARVSTYGPSQTHRTAVSATLPPCIEGMDTLLTSQLLLSDVSEVNRGPLFATAFVFFLTFWGSISFVKGSTKDRITQASFTLSQPAPDIAKNTARYLMQRSFVADPTLDERKGVMTFTGQVRASSSVASILVAVAASGLWAATYILNFVLPPAFQSDYWGLLTLGAFAIVPWYWKQANRTEYVKVMVEEDDQAANPLSTLYVKGHRDEIGELEKHFSWKRNEPVYEDDKKEADPPNADPTTTSN